MEYGFWSVVPPLVTIILALAIKNVFVALMIGIFLASFVLADFNLYNGVNDTFYGLVHTFESNSNTIVITTEECSLPIVIFNININTCVNEHS